MREVYLSIYHRERAPGVMGAQQGDDTVCNTKGVQALQARELGLPKGRREEGGPPAGFGPPRVGLK